MPMYVYRCPKCDSKHTAFRSIADRNKLLGCRTDGCDGAAARAGIERSHFYLRTDHTPAGGDGKRGWSSPGMSGIDYAANSGPDGINGTHLTYGYAGEG